MQAPKWLWLVLRRLLRKPRGVRVIHADGRVTPCKLTRAPKDASGKVVWLATMPSGKLFDPLRGDEMRIAVLPLRTNVQIRVDYQRNGNESWPTLCDLELSRPLRQRN
jgi:hypothetical protein